MCSLVDVYTTCNGKYAEDQMTETQRAVPLELASLLFQVAFSLPIGFSTSLEGSVIKMNPAALAEDSMVSLKA